MLICDVRELNRINRTRIILRVCFLHLSCHPELEAYCFSVLSKKLFVGYNKSPAYLPLCCLLLY